VRPFVVALALACGCAYESQYAAPRDGRARALWVGEDVALDFGGATVTNACLEQLRAVSTDYRLHLAPGLLPTVRDAPPREHHGVVGARAGFWLPPLRPAPSLPPRAPVVKVSRGDWCCGKGIEALLLPFLALVVLPIVDVAVAAATPESTDSSDAIDQVNVYNDLARTTDTPCSDEAPR